MEDQDQPTDRQRLYAQNLARGLDSRAAALAAGYSESFSRVASHRLMKLPSVAKEVEAIRHRAREIVSYDVTVAMQEALDALNFAKEKGNAMAYCKAVELRAKLSGLLVDRVEVAYVDLSGS